MTQDLIVTADPALPLLHLSVVTKSGALLDPPGKEGATRLLFRLMRRSVLGMTPEEVDEAFDGMGATLGVDVQRSVAGFHGGCIARQKTAFFSLVRQLVAQPDFSSDEFSRLKDEALADWHESIDSDSTLVRRAFTRHLFVDHPYGRLAGGDAESLQKITLDDLKSLHQSLFRSSSLIVSLAGDVSEREAVGLKTDLDSALNDALPNMPEISDPQLLPGRRLIFVDKPERTQTQIAIGGMGTHPLDEDHTALYIAHTIFGGTFTSRLSREVRGKRGWSYGASSSLPIDRKRQAFSLWTFPKSEDAAACIRLELELLEKLIEKGVTKSEISAAKRYLSNSHVFSVDTAAKRASLALDAQIYHLPEGYFDEYLQRISACTLEEVNAAIKRRLSAEDLLICVVGTKESILQDLTDSIPRLKTSTVYPFNAPAG